MHSLVAKGARVARECVSPLPVEGYWDSRLDPDRCQQIPLQPPEHGRKLGWAYLPPGRLPPWLQRASPLHPLHLTCWELGRWVLRTTCATSSTWDGLQTRRRDWRRGTVPVSPVWGAMRCAGASRGGGPGGESDAAAGPRRPEGVRSRRRSPRAAPSRGEVDRSSRRFRM